MDTVDVAAAATLHKLFNEFSGFILPNHVNMHNICIDTVVGVATPCMCTGCMHSEDLRATPCMCNAYSNPLDLCYYILH